MTLDEAIERVTQREQRDRHNFELANAEALRLILERLRDAETLLAERDEEMNAVRDRAQDAEACTKRLADALRELHTRSESFWAYLQGEHGVKLGSAGESDHNVSGFFAALEQSTAALEPTP